MKKAFLVALPDEIHHLEEINGAPVFFSGIGKLNAAIGASELIRQGAEEIINIGSCGSTRHTLGEIIRVGKVYQDIDCSPICEYGLTAFEEDKGFIQLTTEVDNSCFTTDYFYDHKQLDKYSPNYVDMVNRCSVFDMELYAIAKVCFRQNVKVSSYKWVSDDGDFSKWMENCMTSSKRVIEMLSK